MTRPGPREDFSARQFERILLIKPSSLGDVVHALPVLHALRNRFPNARIDWLVSSGCAPLLEGHKDISELILFDRRKFSRLGRSLSVTRDFLMLVQKLRARKYDLVIDLQGLFRSGFLARASGAPIRIGPGDAREGATLFYTHKVRPGGADEHAVDRNLRVGELIGFDCNGAAFPLHVADHVRQRARTILDAHGATGPLIVIAPSARWETKIWPMPNLRELIGILGPERPDLSFVLIGGKEDAELCRQVAESQEKCTNLAGKTSLQEMAAILERADVVVCHDSAPMHIAVALGRPLVCLTGPTNPHRTGPYRRLSDVLRVPLPCSPCYLRKLSQCGYDHRCMRELKVETVTDRVRLLLAQGPRAGAAASSSAAASREIALPTSS